MHLYAALRIDGKHSFPGCVGFFHTYGVYGSNDLTVKISLAYGIIVDQVKVSDSCPCKSFHYIASYPAEAEDGNSGVPKSINAFLSY